MLRFIATSAIAFLSFSASTADTQAQEYRASASSYNLSERLEQRRSSFMERHSARIEQRTKSFEERTQTKVIAVKPSAPEETKQKTVNTSQANTDPMAPPSRQTAVRAPSSFEARRAARRTQAQSISEDSTQETALLRSAPSTATQAPQHITPARFQRLP